MGCWLASFKGHTLDLEVTFRSRVIVGLQVEAVGELECVSIWQLNNDQLCLVEGDAHLCDTSRLEGEDRFSMLLPPHPCVLAVTRSFVDVPMYLEARIEVQAPTVAICAQVQHEAFGVGGHLAPHSNALPGLRFALLATRPTQAMTEDRRMVLGTAEPAI